jgi:hypothetical protein
LPISAQLQLAGQGAGVGDGPGVLVATGVLVLVGTGVLVGAGVFVGPGVLVGMTVLLTLTLSKVAVLMAPVLWEVTAIPANTGLVRLMLTLDPTIDDQLTPSLEV